eukprot:gene11999-15095_t
MSLDTLCISLSTFASSVLADLAASLANFLSTPLWRSESRCTRVYRQPHGPMTRDPLDSFRFQLSGFNQVVKLIFDHRFRPLYLSLRSPLQIFAASAPIPPASLLTDSVIHLQPASSTTLKPHQRLFELLPPVEQVLSGQMSEAKELLPSSCSLGPGLDDELYPGDDQEDHPLNCNDWIPDGYAPLGSPAQGIYTCLPEATKLPKTCSAPAEPARQESVETNFGPCSLPLCSQDMFDDQDGMDLALTSVHNHSSDIGSSEMNFDGFEPGLLAESPHSNSEPLLYQEPLPPLPPLQQEPHTAMLERELGSRHMASHHNSLPTPSQITLQASYNTDPSIGHLEAERMPMSLDPSTLQSHVYSTDHSQAYSNCTMVHEVSSGGYTGQPDFRAEWDAADPSGHGESVNDVDFYICLDSLVERWVEGSDTSQPDFRAEWDAADPSEHGESVNGVDF